LCRTPPLGLLASFGVFPFLLENESPGDLFQLAKVSLIEQVIFHFWLKFQ